MKSCTIIFSTAPNFVRDLLGRGGAAIYPPAEGVCPGCGILIRSNSNMPLRCPHCQTVVMPTTIHTFSEWEAHEAIQRTKDRSQT